MRIKQYEYTQCIDGATQYDDCLSEDSKILIAQYIPALVSMDKGNPYIEALPLPRTEEEVKTDYTRRLLSYDYNEVKNMTPLEKMVNVGTLRNIRFPLTFHKNLEFSFYNALLTSYRARKLVEGTKESRLCGDSGDSTNAGFSLIGYSGCGKSSALNILFSRYPQVILHETENGDMIPQVVYLVVNCIPNSNFSALYEGIGDALDKAFNLTESTYAEQIRRTQGLGKKMEVIKNYIERFGIGMIIFDEIQLINFSKTKENSFESLMILANRTKVAVAVVGTEDARDKMFSELRTARRIGTMINGNTYCEQRHFFEFLVRQLFQYQWFDTPVALTEEIINALYDVTKGIVDQLVGVYSCMHYDYLDRKKKPIVDAEYIYKITSKYYAGIQEILANMESLSNTEKIRQMRENVEQTIQATIDKAAQAESAKDILSSQNSIANQGVQVRNIAAIIKVLYDDYTDAQIEEAFNKVMKRKSSQGKTEKAIAQDVVAILQQGPRKKMTSTVLKPQTIHIPDVRGAE